MAYIKISDPKVIDLPTIHQIINVVNQHSDNITALTNNYGNIYNGSSTSGATTEYQFDLSSQQIVYGVTPVVSTAQGFSYSASPLFEYIMPVKFVGNGFSQHPIIMAQASVSSTSTNFLDLIVNVRDITLTGFNIYLRHAANNSAWLGTSTVNVNWVAIGPR